MAHLFSVSSSVRRGVCMLLAGLSVVAVKAHAADGVTTSTREVPAATQAVSKTADGAQTQRTATGDVGRTDVEGVRTRSTDAKPEDPAAQKVRGRFSERFSSMPVTAVTRTPYGLFEVQVGGELLYTDEGVTFVMPGPLVDAKTREDMSAKRQEVLSAVEFDTLPLGLALKSVRGDGSRKLASFEDPNCGYCKQLARTLESVDNVTVYTFMFPILSQDSIEKSKDIWCSSDPAQAWDDWMLRAKAPAKASAECNAPLESWMNLGRKLMVRGTPAIYFQDGTRAGGALPLQALNERLQRQ